MASKMKTVVRAETKIPVAYEADVVVAGAGCAGLIAALAAARRGQKVALVDRMPAPGGNLGPGMIGGAPFGMKQGDAWYRPRLAGVALEFHDRLRAAMEDMPEIYAVVSHAASRTAIEMCRESGVKLILSAFASDPIMKRNRAAGLFIETKSGTIAVTAKAVVDATGDADIAARAGAPVRRVVAAEEISTPIEQPNPEGANLRNPKYRNWNDGQIYFYLGDAEIAKYVEFCKSAKVTLTPAQRAWARKNLRIIWKGWPDPMIPILKAGWDSGEFFVEKEVRPCVHVALNNWFAEMGSRPNIMGGRAGIFGDYDTGNWEDVTLMETEVRSIIFDGCRWFRKQKVPGFEKAFVLTIAPFFGARGGPFIEGEYVLTPQEAYDGARFPDVCASQYYYRAEPTSRWFDWPYRALLPRRVDGLIVCGRGASFVRRGHDSSLRARCRMMALGEAAGLAAAIAAEDGVSVKKLNVRKLQRAVLKAGYFLGDAARLKELGLP